MSKIIRFEPKPDTNNQVWIGQEEAYGKLSKTTCSCEIPLSDISNFWTRVLECKIAISKNRVQFGIRIPIQFVILEKSIPHVQEYWITRTDGKVIENFEKISKSELKEICDPSIKSIFEIGSEHGDIFHFVANVFNVCYK